MNERIKLLAKQARQIGEYGNYSQIQLSTKQFEQKFAKLIIKECAEVVQDFVNYRLPASEYPEGLKNHFGVEE